MSRWLLLISFFLLPICSQAEQDKMTVYLIWENNLGIKKQKSLHVEARRILVNSRPIDSMLWPRILPSVQKLGQTQATIKRDCTAGTYLLSVANHLGKKKIERGCLNSKRFVSLSSQFAILELNARLN